MKIEPYVRTFEDCEVCVLTPFIGLGLHSIVGAKGVILVVGIWNRVAGIRVMWLTKEESREQG